MLRGNRFAVAVVAALALSGPVARAETPIGNAFTYQGELAVSGSPASGTFDLRFHLYDDSVAGLELGSVQCFNDVAVSGGRFSVTLDFGNQFVGNKRWLGVEVRSGAAGDCTNPAGFTTLSPRQEITLAPHARYAKNADLANFAVNCGVATNAAQLNGQGPSFYRNASNLTGTLPAPLLAGSYPSILNLSNPANVFIGSGAGLTNLSASSISTGVLDPARMPTNWAAGGDLSGFYPSPTIGAGMVSREKLSTDVQGALGSPVLVSPQQIGSAVSAGAYAVAVSGSYAYVVNATPVNTLHVFDISNPAAPVLAGSVATDTNPVSVAVSGSYAYVVNYDSSTLQVFNVSNPTAPALAGSVATDTNPYSVAVSGTYAHVVNRTSNTLQVFNVSTPAAPTLAGSAATDTRPYSVAVSGSYAHVVNETSNTLQVFNVSNPAAPVLTGSVSTGLNSNPYSVAVSGSFAYVVNYTSNTLQVFNVSNPAAPALTATVFTAPDIHPYSVAVSGSYVHVVSIGTNKLLVYDVSTPAAPTLTGRVAMIVNPYSVAVSGPNAYVVGGASLLLVFGQTFGTMYSAPATVFSGNVGIGTTFPDSLLSVNGSASKSGGGSWSTFSDARLKHDIKPLEGTLDKLLALRGVSFYYNDPASINELAGQRIGMVAQEVERVFPDWVEMTSRGYKSLTFRGFEALTVEALRDLRTEKDAQIEVLHAENEALKARLEKIEALIAGGGK